MPAQRANIADVLFKGTLANVVVRGHFDQEWKLPAADAARFKEAGVITLTANSNSQMGGGFAAPSATSQTPAYLPPQSGNMICAVWFK